MPTSRRHVWSRWPFVRRTRCGFLLRKKTLVDHVQIDPATFAIALFDAKGRAIPKQRLSEGE
ncbi:MAG: hypothetical protein RBS80_29460, partial [Thermoguttaceae bacterium]|nr:hypothetical protein [Thermoguttaceae bacterium]